jgi:hypothetical protein
MFEKIDVFYIMWSGPDRYELKVYHSYFTCNRFISGSLDHHRFTGDFKAENIKSFIRAKSGRPEQIIPLIFIKCFIYLYDLREQ